MKQRRLTSMLLMLTLVVTVLAHGVPALASAVPSQWAVSEMNDANTSGLLTANAAKDFQRALTRDEFCELVVIMAERMLGRELAVPAENPFIDSTSIHAQKAYNYGVIYGVGNGRFDPNSKVERQQLCAMMVRAIKKLETDTVKSYLQPGAALPFKDNSSIADYAVDSVKQAFSSGIMLGDDTGNFNPAAAITAEQCVAVVIRSLNKMQKTYAEGRTAAQIVDMAYDRLHIGFAYGDTERGVSRDIALPITGAGGAEITWRSSNESVISSEGIVVAGASPETVTLTATVKHDTASRDKVFTLITTPYSGERLLLENAYNALEITYLKSGDGPNSVTGRINLPTSVLGLSVNWLSSNSSVIDSSGAVKLPAYNKVETVTLTANIKGEAEIKQKTFEVKVNNPMYANRGVSLYGVEMGMTQTQVSQVLGSPKRSLQVSSNEVWNVYHSEYKNFVAVAFISEKTVAVYSPAADASLKLLDASNQPLTTAQANGLNGVNAISFADSGNSNREYAIMIYDPSTAIRSSRTLNAEGQEQLLLELVNAYRGSNNRAALLWNSYLGTAARSHTSEMVSYNYLDVTSRSGQSLKDRAGSHGYEAALVSGGNVLGGAIDAVEFLHNMINTTVVRNDILGSNNTVFGTGFTSHGTGQYKTYLTYITGTLRGITAITSNPAEVKVDAGKTQNVTLVLNPTNANESVRWSSSDTSVMTLSGTEGAKSVTVTGVSAGTAYIRVTCVSSGKIYSVPVTVGATYATSLSLKYENTTLTDASKLFLGSGEALQLTPTMAPAVGPVIVWSSSNTNIATVSSTGLVTAKSGAVGTVTISARVNKSAAESITNNVTVYVSAMALESGSDKNISSITINKDDTQVVSININPADSSVGGNYTYEWTSNNENIVLPYPTNQSAVSIKGVESGKAEITLTVRRSDAIGGGIVKKFTVNVRGAEYATGLSLWIPKTTITVNESVTITPTVTPATVEKNTINWYSFDESIAIVNQSGVVTGRKKGITTIYAAMDKQGGEKLIAEVTVEIKDPEIVPNKMEIYVIGGSSEVFQHDTVELAVRFTPTNVTNTGVTWTATNGAAVDKNNIVTFNNIGPVMVTATSKSNGITAVIFFDVK